MDLVDLLIEKLQSLKSSHIKPKEVDDLTIKDEKIIVHNYNNYDDINQDMIDLYNKIVDTQDHQFGPLIDLLIPSREESNTNTTMTIWSSNSSNSNSNSSNLESSNLRNDMLTVESEYYDRVELIIKLVDPKENRYEFISYCFDTIYSRSNSSGTFRKKGLILSLQQAVDICWEAICNYSQCSLETM